MSETRHTALVIDDSRATRRLLGALLRDLGFAVIEAGDAREGFARLPRLRPRDLVLVDWNMPGEDGCAFVRAVRARPRYDPLRLMMVTSEAELDKVAQALEAGADEFAMKPVTREVMADKLKLLGY